MKNDSNSFAIENEKRFMSRFEIPRSEAMTDNCNVNVYFMGDKMYALTETVLLHQITGMHMKKMIASS